MSWCDPGSPAAAIPRAHLHNRDRENLHAHPDFVPAAFHARGLPPAPWIARESSAFACTATNNHLAFAKPGRGTHIPHPFFMNWIGIITNLLTALNVLVCLLIVLLVLLQRPKNEGLGAAFGGDTASNIFGAQTTNVLATLTRWLGAIFLMLCLLIAVLGTHDPKRRGITDTFLQKQKQEQADRDKQKAAEDAAKAASAAVEAARKPALPTSATSAPVQVPPIAPAPAKADDQKPAAPAAPATNAPKPESKPVENKPAASTAPQAATPKAPAPAPVPAPAGN